MVSLDKLDNTCTREVTGYRNKIYFILFPWCSSCDTHNFPLNVLPVDYSTTICIKTQEMSGKVTQYTNKYWVRVVLTKSPVTHSSQYSVALSDFQCIDRIGVQIKWYYVASPRPGYHHSILMEYIQIWNTGKKLQPVKDLILQPLLR